MLQPEFIEPVRRRFDEFNRSDETTRRIACLGQVDGSRNPVRVGRITQWTRVFDQLERVCEVAQLAKACAGEGQNTHPILRACGARPAGAHLPFIHTGHHVATLGHPADGLARFEKVRKSVLIEVGRHRHVKNNVTGDGLLKGHVV